MNTFFHSGLAWASLPIALAFALFVFLVLREVFTWYWKINKIVVLLEQIEENTRPQKEIKKEVQ